MSTTKVSRACPTFFRALCREASRGGRSGSYEWPARGLAPAVHDLIEFEDDDERAAKLVELSNLIWGASEDGRVRSLHGFVACDDAGRVIAWFKRELPRCIELVPPRRYATFLRGLYGYVVEEENDISEY